MKNILTFSYLLIITAWAPGAFSQITTATLSGTVTDLKSQPIASATVLIEYPDAGYKQSLVTKAEGRFTVPNLRVGGPYKITVSHVSYQAKTTNDIFLELGLNNTVNITMSDASQSLETVVVSARSSIFDDKRTGASTNISNRQLKTLPTISRSADDFLRITPSASSTFNGLSFGGRNGQYNNFSLDGAVFNNPFGLDAPTPGGQTSAQPVSLDAIEQIQVNLAPFDVTQAGFTGAGINTVTKSGTNRFTGTAYVFYRNQSFTGKKVDKNSLVVPKLTQMQAGTAFGGAIKKDKLFYFISLEAEDRTDGASSYVPQNAGNAGKSNTSRVLEADMIAVSNILKTRFNYETGPYQGYTLDQKNFKWLAKLDWNISQTHKLAFTYNGLDASKEKPAHPSAIGRRGPDYTTLQFRNSGYEILNKLHSFSTELKSTLKNNAANKLRVVYTSFRDKRNPFSSAFPAINISKYNVRYIVAGHEPFSIHNRLNQDALQITNDFNLYRGKHSFTFGASYETFKFGNSFNLVAYSPATFFDGDIQLFKDSVPVGGGYVFNFGSGGVPLDVFADVAKNRALADKWTWYYLKVGQLSVYAQDEIQAGKKLKFTVGLRIDKPLYFDKQFKFEEPKINNDGTYGGTTTVSSPTLPNNDNLTLFDANGNSIQNGVGKDLDNTKLPTGSPLFSPRIGFNYDVRGNRSLQLRGGSGLFTGRFPFVWLGNHIGNPTSGFYNATDKNFRWPQVWRTNIGADVKLKQGTVITTDISFTKDVKAMMVRNYNLGKPSSILNSGTGDNRSVYTAADKGTANAYVFTNTNTGHQFNFTLQAQHSFAKSLFAMLAYNYGIAKDASSISAEISSDAFDRNPILNNANQAVNSNSLYGNKHRIVAVASKKFEYGKMATTISLFGSWTSGNRFAYVYGGDINNDGTFSNDLLYVPTNTEIDNMNFVPLTDINGTLQDAAAQRSALKTFISQDKYLNGLRGQYTEKYGGETPWFSQLDIRILQDLYFNKDSKKGLQFSVDLINAANLLSSEWGVRKYATTSGYFQPVTVFYNNNNPSYQFDPSLKKTFNSSPDLESRWQLQLGLRYNF